MKTMLKSIGALAVIVAAGATPAKADYVILEDTRFPSVLFIEFDDAAVTPTVISAPSGSFIDVDQADLDPIIIQSPSDSPAPVEMNTRSQRAIENLQKTPEQREMEQARDFDNMSDAEIERVLEDDIIEDEILTQSGLR